MAELFPQSSELPRHKGELVAWQNVYNGFDQDAHPLSENSLDKDGILINLYPDVHYFLFTMAETIAYSNGDYEDRADLLTPDEIKLDFKLVEFPSLGTFNRSTTKYHELEKLRLAAQSSLESNK